MKNIPFLICLFSTVCFAPVESSSLFNSCCSWWNCRSNDFYILGEVGYARIDSPTENHTCSPYDSPVKSCKGDFAWGIHAGIETFMQSFNCIKMGLEAGYNDNGSSELTYLFSGNSYRISSWDWTVMVTTKIFFTRCLYTMGKMGVGQGTQTYKIHKISDPECVDPKSTKCRVMPALVLGLGYQSCRWLDFSIYYRGIYDKDQSDVNNAFRLNKNNYEKATRSLRDCASVHAVYAGLSLLF